MPVLMKILPTVTVRARERARDGDALRFTSGEHASALFGKIGETDIG